jgi:transcriptional regulator with XRE-family HTH domain
MNLKLKGKIIEVYGTQADFAQRINKDESYVSRVVRGRRNITQNEQDNWAGLLGVGRRDLFPDLHFK